MYNFNFIQFYIVFLYLKKNKLLSLFFFELILLYFVLDFLIILKLSLIIILKKFINLFIYY
jgi:hypothetical protein